jgi:hypothetical protein
MSQKLFGARQKFVHHFVIVKQVRPRTKEEREKKNENNWKK